MTPVVTAEALLDVVARSGLLAPEFLEPYIGADPPGDPGAPQARRLAAQLVRDGLLTPFQAGQIARGRHRGFFLTPKYKLLALLGVGGMGKVFLCEQLLLQRLVAVKLLAGTGDGPPAAGAVERFYREAQAVAALDSPHVVKVYDVDAARGEPFMVMEYVDGADLHKVTASAGPLPVATAAEYARQAALGLAAAHAAGLVHRDIKPGNILADRQGAVKLLDLGLARFFADAGRNQNLTARFDGEGVLGTADFVAPEQITATSAADIRSDLYGLGGTLFFLLTGRTVFAEGTNAQKLMWHQFREPPPLAGLRADVPAELAAVVARLLAKAPADRFQTPAEVAAALAPFAAGRPVPPPAEVLPKVRPEAYRLGLSRLPPPSGSGEVALAPAAPPVAPHTPRPREGASTDSMHGEVTAPLPASPPRVPPAGGRPATRRIWVYVAAGIVVVAAGLFGAFVYPGLERAGDRPTASPAVPTPAAPPAAVKTLAAGGGTFSAPMIERWAAVYAARTGVKVEYDAVGALPGIEGLLAGKYRFANTTAPLTDAQIAAARAAGKEVRHVPILLGAVAPTYNVPGLPAGMHLRFNGSILAEIYLGRISRWNDERIVASNIGLGVTLPDLPIRVVYRSDPCGITFIWTEYLSAVSATWRDGPGRGTEVTWPAGEGAALNTGVTDLVNRTPGAIGYSELSGALQDGLPTGEVRNKAGRSVVPSLAGVTAAATAVADRIPDDMRFSLVDPPGTDSYPVCGMTRAVLCYPVGGQPDPDAVAFLEWVTHAGQAHVTELRYAPLPDALQLRLDGIFYRLKAKH